MSTDARCCLASDRSGVKVGDLDPLDPPQRVALSAIERLGVEQSPGEEIEDPGPV